MEPHVLLYLYGGRQESIPLHQNSGTRGKGKKKEHKGTEKEGILRFLIIL